MTDETQTEDASVLTKKFTLHLVSDASGTTLLGLARAVISQFDNVEPAQKFWPLVRTQRQLESIIARIEENPGPVVFTMVNKKMRRRLQDRCEELNIPCVAVLDPIIRSLSTYLSTTAKGVPGLQHTMDDAYFRRVEAVDFAMRHDDGKDLSDIHEADVILVGVSRTSKTPTSIFLARRGIKVANIPLVPGVPVPPEKFELDTPFYVGLTASPERLMHIRRARLKADDSEHDHDPLYCENAYLDLDKIEQEIKDARRLYTKHGWPIINVTKRSIEETSAEIMGLLQASRDKKTAQSNTKKND